MAAGDAVDDEAHDICQIVGLEMETEKRIRGHEEEEEESEFDRQARRQRIEDLKGQSRVRRVD